MRRLLTVGRRSCHFQLDGFFLFLHSRLQLDGVRPRKKKKRLGRGLFGAFLLSYFVRRDSVGTRAKCNRKQTKYNRKHFLQKRAAHASFSLTTSVRALYHRTLNA